jgi:hypothetical protein
LLGVCLGFLWINSTDPKWETKEDARKLKESRSKGAKILSIFPDFNIGSLKPAYC